MTDTTRSTSGRQDKSKQFAAERRNRWWKQAVRAFARNDKQLLHEEIQFTCECSDGNCRQTICLSIKDYESYHKIDGQHVLLKGHENPSFETIVAVRPEFLLVRKFS